MCSDAPGDEGRRAPSVPSTTPPAPSTAPPFRRPLVKICGLTRAEDVWAACGLGAWAVGFVFAPSPRRVTPARARELAGVASGPSASPHEPPRAATAAGAPAGAGPGPGLTVSAGPPLGPAVVPSPWGRRLSEGRSRKGLSWEGPSWQSRDRPLTVGVFGDQPAEEIAWVVREAGLDGVQLHSCAGPGGRAVRKALAALGRGEMHPVLIIQVVPVAAGCSTDVEALRAMVAKAREEADVVLLDSSAGGRSGGTGTAFPWHLAREVADGLPLLVAGGIGPENAAAALAASDAWGIDVSSGVESSPGIKDVRLIGRLFARVQEGMRS